MRVLLLNILFLSTSAFAMKVNFNQAWFKTNYSTQYLDPSFDAAEVERIFRLTKEAGSEELRLWFFESATFPMLVFEDGKINGLKSDFVQNVISTLKLAHKHDLKIYMTLFDAHSYRPDQLKRQELKRLKQIYQGNGEQAFIAKALLPLLKKIEEAGLGSVISKIDLINEGDAVVNRLGFQKGWSGFRKMICEWRSAIHTVDAFSKTPVTISVRLHPLVFLPFDILDDAGPLQCADVLDFHSYHDWGKIKSCGRLREYSESGKKKLVLGEFGQSFFNLKFDDRLQTEIIGRYIESAQKCGFSEAFAWRLSDVREGYNKEARYSFFAFDRMRPAYFLIQNHNLASTKSVE